MPILVKRTDSSYTPPDAGVCQAVCSDVVEENPEVNKFSGEPQEKVSLYWQLDLINPKTNKPYEVSRKYTRSLSEKANLRKHIESWLGRKLGQAELDTFDLESLMGINCQLQIVHNTGNDGKVYANVQNIMPLGKGMMPIQVTSAYVRRKDRNMVPPAAEAVFKAYRDDEAA